MSGRKRTVSINASTKSLRKIDYLVRSGIVQSRNAFYQIAIKNLLKSEKVGDHDFEATSIEIEERECELLDEMKSFASRSEAIRVAIREQLLRPIRLPQNHKTKSKKIPKGIPAGMIGNIHHPDGAWKSYHFANYSSANQE